MGLFTNDKEDNKSNIGLDFGTTYSVLARVESSKTEAGVFEPRAIPLPGEVQSSMSNAGGIYYDSLVLRDNTTDQLITGKEVRNEMVRRNITHFRGFKMLLGADEEDENNRRLLENQGYTETCTPERVVKEYLRSLFSNYNIKSGSIDRLVVGVPYIWDSEKKGSGYRTLLTIFEELQIADEVIFLSEPMAACGYYADHYRDYNEEHKAFEGHLLLVDYGGGTLDIACCEIRDDNGTPLIDIIDKTGAGANTDKVIGKAGLAFMQAVIRILLRKGGHSEDDIQTLQKSGNLDRAAFELEEFFDAYGTSTKEEYVKSYPEYKDAFEELDKDKLDDIIDTNEGNTGKTIVIDISMPETRDGFIRKEFPLDFASIAEAYRDTIFSVLEEELYKIKEIMKNNNIDYTFQNRSFKIQLIGGFSKLYLVEEQIKKSLGIAANINEDLRMAGGIENRTMAVAFGAALHADSRTKHVLRWDYPVGIEYEKGVLWAAKKGDLWVPDRVYLFKRDDHKTVPLIAISNITELVYTDNYENDGEVREEKLDNELAKQLKFNNHDSKGYLMGISRDSHKILSFWWWEIIDGSKFDEENDDIEEKIWNKETVKCIAGGKWGRVQLA